jgi:hypothetical protein
MAIPDFDSNGNLPPGEHLVSWTKFATRYGYNAHRAAILDSIKRLLAHIQAAGCRTAWIDGSFVCDKDLPGDFDACWDYTGINVAALDPLFLDATDQGVMALKQKYGGDVFPDRASPPASILSYVQYFQRDRLRRPKGIIRMDVRSLIL